MYKKRSLLLRKAVAACFVLMLATTPLFAQQPETVTSTITTGQVLFWAMMGMVCLLAIVIAVFASLLSTSVQLKYGKKENDAKTSDSALPRILPLVLLLVFIACGNSTFAQETQTSDPVYGDMNPFLFYGLTAVIIILLGIIGLLYRAIMMVLKPKMEKEPVKAKAGFLEKLNASVPLEQEKDVMLDHDYDGIRELDNNLPPWWKYGFYVTIVFACIYLWRFHVSESAPLQLAEYKEQLATAEVEVAAYKEKMGNLVDETNATVLTEAADIASGKSLFTANCAACHGQLGEGGVGPNLTDAYWLHGGSVKDIFKTIKYGWPQKGMKSWEKDFGAKQIQELSSYILTLQGTNPPNAKEKQGELYEDLPVTSDSTTTALKE